MSNENKFRKTDLKDNETVNLSDLSSADGQACVINFSDQHNQYYDVGKLIDKNDDLWSKNED